MTSTLHGFYRTPKTYTQIPSRGVFYDQTVLDMIPETEEVGIKAMTSQDEMLFKNPDALLNGDAVSNVLKSCVSGLKDPRKLFTNDVDALIVAIRIASFGEEMDIKMECPECKEDNVFGFSLSHCLSTMKFIEDSYDVILGNGLRVNIHPYYYSDTIKALLSTFEQSKLIRALENTDTTEDEKLKAFSKTFNSLLNSNIDMMVNSINYVAHDENNIKVDNTPKNKQELVDFIKNIEKADSDIIQEKIKEINSIGIDKSTHAICSKCNHEWDTMIEIDPVVFFSGS